MGRSAMQWAKECNWAIHNVCFLHGAVGETNHASAYTFYRPELTEEASDSTAWFHARENATTVDKLSVCRLVKQVFRKGKCKFIQCGLGSRRVRS
jgi:hypothetical protein